MVRRPFPKIVAPVAAAVLLCTTVLAAPPPGRASAASSTAAAWRPRLDLAGVTSLADVSCASREVCTAVGFGPERGVIFGTTDGGTTWSREVPPARTGPLLLVTCPTVRSCLAAGDGPYAPIFLVTSDGGVTWHSTGGALGRDEFDLLALACPTATVCVAATYQGFARSVNGGATWSVPRGGGLHGLGPEGLSCPTARTCFAAVVTGARRTVEVRRSDDAGASFSTVVAGLAAGTGTASISCASSLECAVAGLGSTGRVVTWTADGGTRWRATALPSAVGPAVGLRCAAAAACTLVAAANNAATTSALVAVASTNGGRTWRAAPLAPIPPIRRTALASAAGGVTCTAGGGCLVDGYGIPNGSVLASASDGGAWRRVGVAVGLPPLSAVACPTSSRCVAVGEDGLLLWSSDGGRHWWPSATQLGRHTSMVAVACPSATRCVAVGQVDMVSGPLAGRTFANAFRSADAGATWQRSALPAGDVTLSGVACATATTCVATTGPSGADLLRTTDGAATWARERPVGAAVDLRLNGVSCGSATDCVAVGEEDDAGAVVVSTTGGASWHVLVPSDVGFWLSGVSCTTAVTCWASGLAGAVGPGAFVTGIYETRDGGTTWSVRGAPSTMNDTGIVCADAACVELATTDPSDGPVVSAVSTTADDGASWTTATLPSDDVVLTGAAHAPSGRWVVVGSNARNGPLVLTSP